MKKLWEKTKKSVTVGVAKMDEKFSHKSIDDDPEFVLHEGKLSEVDKAFSTVNQSINELNSIIKRNGIVLATLGDALLSSIPEENSKRNFAVASQLLGKNVKTLTENAFNYYIPTHVLQPLTKAIDQVRNLKRIKEKCKKNRILLTQEEKKLKEARAKDHEISKHEENVQKRQDKYTKYHGEFIAGVAEIYENRSTICVEVYTAAIYYLGDIFRLIQKEIGLTHPECSVDELYDKYPSCKETPPSTTTTTTTTTTTETKKKT
ncbi:hypothetical protein TRFO_23225 [Tritrichomonas foetus]|uniref:BAR domain-containing protein n=1 Tax=Tritrichomonas foetus TaxID=1144522 RepID=A0A1J4K9U6_9EUKA|nr:hypothetical protein TRFO_23225 [Tritrichomonas foetus]|eukprot:OHT08241.1 hypothetical protein TRFO_23225 [Tritrichomonas foetus]